MENFDVFTYEDSLQGVYSDQIKKIDDRIKIYVVQHDIIASRYIEQTTTLEEAHILYPKAWVVKDTAAHKYYIDSFYIHHGSLPCEIQSSNGSSSGGSGNCSSSGSFRIGDKGAFSLDLSSLDLSTLERAEINEEDETFKQLVASLSDNEEETTSRFAFYSKEEIIEDVSSLVFDESVEVSEDTLDNTDQSVIENVVEEQIGDGFSEIAVEEPVIVTDESLDVQTTYTEEIVEDVVYIEEQYLKIKTLCLIPYTGDEQSVFIS